MRPARRGPLPHVLNVLVLDPAQKFGSLEEQVCVLAQQFRAEGSLFLPLLRAPRTEQDRPIGGTRSGCPVPGPDPFPLVATLGVGGLLKRHRIRVIHWNFTQPLTNKYVWALTLLTPWVQHYFTDHNSRYLPAPGPVRGVMCLVKRLLFRRYRKVVGVSRYVLECLQAQGIWTNLTYYLHFINTERSAPMRRLGFGCGRS